MIKVAVRKPWENANSIAQEGLHTIGLLPGENSKMVRSFDVYSMDDQGELIQSGPLWCIGDHEVDHGPWAGLDRTKGYVPTR